MSKFIIGPKHAGESILIKPDFGPLLAVGETISGASSTSVVYSGTDASPSSVISGAASVAGTVVTQKLTAGTAGVTYLITVTVTNTSLGQVLEMYGYLTITPATS
jgi:hypothetical protein